MSTRPRSKRFSLHLTFAVIALFVPIRAALADPIAIWNFNDSDLVVDHGAGTLVSNFNLANIGFAAGSTNNARLGDPAGQALSLQGGSSNANNGRNITASVNTSGFASILVSLATQGTGTGFNSNQFQYSLDGVTFANFGSPYTPLAAFGLLPIVFDLSGIPGLNNNPNAAFRIVFNGATTSTGNNRIDNFVVEGSSTATPEPTTMVLLGTGLVSLLTRRWVWRVRARAVNRC
jgi:hypothetical protein